MLEHDFHFLAFILMFGSGITLSSTSDISLTVRARFKKPPRSSSSSIHPRLGEQGRRGVEQLLELGLPKRI
jgi:hypothetical protein